MNVTLLIIRNAKHEVKVQVYKTKHHAQQVKDAMDAAGWGTAEVVQAHVHGTKKNPLKVRI